MSKTVHPSKFSEWLGLDRISTIIHNMKCIWREISKDDFGIDGEIELVEAKPDGKGYQTTGGIIKVQAKSGNSYIHQDTAESFGFRCEVADLELWHRSNFPTLLIVYHPGDDRLYWKHTQSYIKQTSAVWTRPHRFIFDKNNDELSPETHERLLGIAQVAHGRVAHGTRERLFSNLLPIQQLPHAIWSASCSLSAREVYASAPGLDVAFVIHAGRLWTFQNLSQPHRFEAFVDNNNVEEHLVSELISGAERQLVVWLMNDTLKEHLRRQRIRFDKNHHRYYFMATPGQDQVSHSWYNVRTGRLSSRTVVKRYQYGGLNFWRHFAGQMQFIELGERWFLQITPQYHFTRDGQVVWEGEKAREYAITQQGRELNTHVLTHVLFWSATLAVLRSREQIELYTQATDSLPAITIERLPIHGETDFGIVLDPALEVEPEPEMTPQLSLFQNTEFHHD
jgi:hypothetical protein